MPFGLIGSGEPPKTYTNYTIMSFPDWRALEAFAKKIKLSPESEKANAKFKEFVEQQIDTASYGLFGKNPKTYEEAMSRDKFLYYEEYKQIKDKVEKQVIEKLQKSSVAEIMKPKFVFNDKQIGEFIYDRAAMTLKPKFYWYCPEEDRVVDAINEKIVLYVPSKKQVVADEKVLIEGNIMVLEDKKRSIVINAIKKDGKYLEVVYAIKVKKKDGSVEYVKYKDEDTLKSAMKLGIIDCTSSNKKVYLYKENKPKEFKSIKIIVALSAGGFTRWTNDFYTGVTASIILEVLESLGYSVEVVIAVGGGRCSGCYKKLYFDGKRLHGRRFFTFKAKKFDEQLDKDGLLYTLCDPSFHNIKFISLLNSFFDFFGDEIDTNGNPASTWHGIYSGKDESGMSNGKDNDLVNPIGAYQKSIDIKNGNNNLLHFYIHKVKDEAGVIQAVTDIALECENLNLEALKKYKSNEFKSI